MRLGTLIGFLAIIIALYILWQIKQVLLLAEINIFLYFWLIIGKIYKLNVPVFRNNVFFIKIPEGNVCL